MTINLIKKYFNSFEKCSLLSINYFESKLDEIINFFKNWGTLSANFSDQAILQNRYTFAYYNTFMIISQDETKIVPNQFTSK